MLLGHASVQTTERYLGTKQDLVHAPNDGIKLSSQCEAPASNSGTTYGVRSHSGIGKSSKGCRIRFAAALGQFPVTPFCDHLSPPLNPKPPQARPALDMIRGDARSSNGRDLFEGGLSGS